MQTIQAVITGAIQGLSEFLPISSSAHIVFSHEICGLISGAPVSQDVNQEEIFFDILVHLATLFAVIIYFFNDLKNIFSDFFKSIKEKDYKSENVKLVGYIALSVIITGVIGLLLKDKVEFLTTKPQIVCFLLMGTGFILLFSEKMYKGNKNLSLKTAILISIAQGLAVFPGFSRSGLTISTALIKGMKRVDAARFSFLISIPVIFLASLVYPLLELDFEEITETAGDSFARYMVRMREIEQCVKLLEQLCDLLEKEEGNEYIAPKVPKIIKLPAGHWFQQVEASRGAFGVYIESTGEKTPYRMHFNSPCLNILGSVDLACRGYKIADLITITASLDYVIPDIDR